MKPVPAAPTQPVDSRLEPDFVDPYNAWKADPSPAQNAAMLKALHPVIEGAVRTHVGEPHPLIMGRARRMTLEGLKGYDPARGRLQTHLYNHLQGLKRVARQQSVVLKVPERVQLDRQLLQTAEQDLAHRLGREPTDDELADHTGFSPRRLARVRSYNPAVAEGTVESAHPEAQEVFGGTRLPGQRQKLPPWHAVIYDELSPFDRKVMEYAFGLNGRRPLANQDIARKLGRSPGLISQRKAHIQKLLDQGDELSPFGG